MKLNVQSLLNGVALLTDKERVELLKELSATYCSLCGINDENVAANYCRCMVWAHKEKQ